LVASPWRTLAKAVDALPRDPTAQDLHQIRILAKRVRYAAEAAGPVVGKKAFRFAAALAGLQTVLGHHQDATVAEAWLRTAVEGADATVSLAAGELIAVQLAEASACRRQWPKAWDRAAGKKLRSWM
jgi:CHAD domain-containing protein